MSEVTSFISLMFFVFFVIFGIISHIRKSGWTIGLFSLAGICLVVFILMGIGQLFYKTTVDVDNEPVVPDQADVDEEKMESITVLQSKIKIGMDKDEYRRLVDQAKTENIRNFFISDEEEGNVWKGSDGYLVVITDSEKVIKSALFKTIIEVDAYEKEAIEAAEQDQEEPSEEPNPNDNGSEENPTKPNDNTSDPVEDDKDPEVEYIVYKVAKGDTLWGIAQRAGVTTEQIIKWNELDSNVIFVGQSLIIYGKEPGPPPPPKPAEPENLNLEPSVLVSHGNLQRKQIAFTFDAGSDIAGIQILDVLKKHNMKSTFFLTGKWVEKFPDYARRIAAEGHEISSHSYSHPDFTKISHGEILEELSRTEKIIKTTTGISSRPYFRFPYGAYNSEALKSVGEAGYPFSIQWSLDTIDWKQPSAETIISRILNGASNGDIVLMHIGAINSPNAVEQVIPKLKEKGYEIVPLSQIFNK